MGDNSIQNDFLLLSPIGLDNKQNVDLVSMINSNHVTTGRDRTGQDGVRGVIFRSTGLDIGVEISTGRDPVHQTPDRTAI